MRARRYQEPGAHGAESRIFTKTGRRALFGARLDTCAHFAAGVSSDRRTWGDSIAQTFYSAKEIRTALYVLIAGIGFDSYVIASAKLRAQIFEALQCACNILYLQRRDSMTYADVEECKASYRRIADVLSQTSFATYKKSGLNYPKWLFALLNLRRVPAPRPAARLFCGRE